MVGGSNTRIVKATALGVSAVLRPLCLILLSLLCVTAVRAQTVLVGDQTLESNLDSNAVGLAEAFPATAAASGSVGSINFFLDESSAATKIYVGIYKDASGKPGTLLTQGSTTQLFPGTWNTATVSAVSLTSGTPYWIAILGTTGGVPYFLDRSTTACHSQTSSQSNLTSLPSTWTTGQTWNTCYISAYAVTGTLPATAMIGDQEVESYLDKNPAGRAEAFPAMANITGTVGAIALYLDPTSGSGPVSVGLYADNGHDHPGTLLGQGSTSSPVAGSWNQISITPSSGITSGSRYWIAVLGTQATSPYFRDSQTTVCHSETTPQTTLTSLPATWSTGTVWNTCYISAYGVPATGSPVLSVSSSTLSFAAIQGGANPAVANLSVTNTGTGTLSFTATTDQSWLSVTPTTGTAPQTLQVSAAVGSLSAGTYTGHVTVTATGAQNSPAVVTVTFTVSPFVPPSITAAASPVANANGWNNSTVTVTFTCTAGSYPVQTCPAPNPVSTEGANQSICGQAVDTHGNSSVAACVKLNIDKTAPTITATVSPAPVNGINYGSATVTFTCSDALSGVATCSSPVTDTTIGANQKITGTATDKAGNSNSTSVTLNIQPTVSPTITATPSPAANANGWNNTNVTVTFTCTAGSYPIQTCPAPIVVSTAGANQSICGHAVDTQGNSSLPACDNVNLDKTPPTITAAVSPTPVGGVNYGSATVTFTCSDALSGVATCPSPITDTTIGANQNISGTATDKAGNSSSASVTLNIQPVVLPTITATPSPVPNANGWNDANVTVSFTCTAGSYSIQTCPAPIVVSTEGANQSACAHAVDTQGNSSLPACVSVSLDKTPPTITAAVSPAPVGGINYGSATVTFTCSDSLSGVATCPSPITDTTIGANQNISGTATDKAGNSNSASVTLNIQSVTPPAIIATTSPAPNATGWNNTNVTVSFACTAGSFPIKICPSPIVVSSEGKNQSICGTAVDTQGNSSSPSCVNLNIDKTPPTVIPNLSPAPNAGGWETSPVTVSFTCSDSLSGVALCPSSTLISSDGANQPVSGTATDVAGNTTTVSANVNLEQARPTISASVSPSANSSGWNNTNVTVTFTCNKSVSNITSCTSPQTVSQGIGQVITGTVQDQAGNQATTSVTLNIDETPPTILQLTAPSQLSPGQSGSATVTVSDTAPVAAVVFQLNGSAIGTVLAPPYTINVTAPSNANSGSTLTLTAVVTDVAGNSNSASKGIQVVSAGVIVGEVLSDATGLPLAGANLQVIGQASQNTSSDSAGRYSIPVTSSQLFLSISEPGSSGGVPAMVNVERQVSVQSGVGTVPADARMTVLAAPVVITAAGGSIGSGAITMTVPAGGSTTSYYLTPLSQQGLPGLLPLGWSPVAAFDLQTNISTSAALSANFTGLPAGTLYLVAYSYTVHAWNMVTPNLSSSNGSLTIAIPSTGDYALVMPDAGNTSIQIPATGQPLTGLPVVTLPTNATSTGSLSPANIAPTGGTSMASLAVQSGTSLPSGTVIQGKVTETYTLTTGQLISDEPRYEDILLYQNPAPSSGAAAAATFPVTPSQTFQVSQLASGDVHLDILSGRESVRGATGGSDPVSVQSGDATLTVAGGSLPQDTAIAVTPETINTFLPSTSTLVPLSEYNVDFSDAVLSNGAQLTVGTAGAAPGTNVVIAEVQRVSGVPYLVVVSMAQVTATNIISQATPGLPGITEGGDYVFYQVTVPTGFVTGTVSAGSGPVAAMVQTDALPFVAFSNASGNYTIIAAAGTVNLTASVANTALAATTTTQVTAGQTATANLTVAGQVEAATITPANGAVGVSLTAEIDITAAAGFNQATVTSSSVVLTAVGNSTPIAVRFVFSNGGATLAVFPQAALQPSTQYTLQASGIANAVGGLISVPTISFTTVAINAPTYNTSSLVFAMPDSNGNVAISAAAGSFPSGSKFLIVDQTNGVVYSLTVFNDGSVTGSMPATINDILQVTLTDPSGNVTNFTVSQFVAADGSVAVGPGGGTVTGPGGVSMIIPPGALTQGAVFQLQSLGASAFQSLPSWGTATFGGGLQITASSMPTFNKEVKLAFPVPANAPAGAFYYVFRQDTDQNNNVYYETIDHAFVQGTGANAQVVTASPPFCGYSNSYSNFQTVATAGFSPLGTAITKTFFMWDWDPNQPGVASTGLIVGNILQTVEANGQTTYVPYTGTAKAQLANTSNIAIFTPPPACPGTFTIFDFQRGGGPRTVTLQAPGLTQPLTATANEVNGIQVNDADYDVTAGLEFEYQNIGRVTFTLPPVTPPPPPPQINIGIFTSDGNPAPGIVQTGTSLTVNFTSSLSVTAATINGVQYSVTTDTPPTPVAPGTFHLNGNPYVPGTPGVYSFTATALPPLGGAPVTSNRSILVVQAGGTNNSVTPQVAPTFSSVPISGTTGVPTTTVPQITFSEPVTNVAGNVTLTDAENNSVPMLLIGIRRPSDPLGPIASPVAASDVITSLTVQPLAGLKFGENYTLSVWKNIVDLNSPPLPLATQANNNTVDVLFMTFGPQPLGSTDQFSSTRPVVISWNGAQTAYVGEYVNASLGGLGVIDVTNPALPFDEGVKADFVGRAVDASGQSSSPVNGGRPLVAIAAGIGEIPLPSNIWLYDVSTPNVPVRVAGLSATTSASQDGALLRIFMKDQYIYTSTYPKGLQVIDLQNAITEYTQVYATNPSGFGTAITTEGSGFGLDSVVNTIAIQLNEYLNGCIPTPQTTCTPEVDSNGNVITTPATMFDVKAATYTLPQQNNTSETLMVATGRLPLVVADPSQSLPAAILYPPQIAVGSLMDLNQEPLSSAAGQCQLPQNALGQCSLSQGRAVALGSLSSTNSQGNTTTAQVAIVVGIGTSTFADVTTPSVPLLAVVNMNNPQSPTPEGFIQLSASPTDVILNGTTAAVATGANVLLIDISNPMLPVSVGQITGNFGGLLAMTTSGFLVTTSTSSTNGGVQTATFQPVVVTSCPGPILAKVVSGAGSANPVYQTVLPVPCSINVVPAATPAANATFSLTQSNQSPVVPNTTLPLSNGAAQVQIPAGTQITGNSVNAQSTSMNTQTGTPIPSLIQVIPMGPVQVVVDSDNDTIIDPVKDPAAAQAGSKFSFWQADPNNTLNGGQDGLLDYAPLRVYVDAVPPTGAGSIQLALKSTDGSNATWVLTRNAGVTDGSSDSVAAANEKLYLTDQPTATKQLALTNPTATNPNGVICGAANGNSFENNLCISQAGYIELPNLASGTMYDMIMSCKTCAQDSTWMLQTLLVSSSGTTVLDQVPLDVRPLQNWMSVYSTRSQGETIPPPGTSTLLSGWTQIPGTAAKLNILVHGYDVSEQDATTTFFPQWFKRLYWAGQPMILPQKGSPHTVGFSWYSDVSLINWPDDEFSALETGVPFANFLAQVADPAKTSNPVSVNIVAHSLGNMVVHSALIRPEVSGVIKNHSILSYVMNEAAVPAETLDTSFSSSDASVLQVAQATNIDSYPLDLGWQAGWVGILATPPLSAEWYATLNSPTYVTLPQPQYPLRWTQQRPIPSPLVSTDNDRGSTPHRGSWGGLFAANPGNVTITNTYSGNDNILSNVWEAAQLFTKPNIPQNIPSFIPYVGGVNLTVTGDNAIIQFWGNLTHQDGMQEQMWGSACYTASTCTHSNVIRQWAELAYWFRAISNPIGYQSLNTVTNINFSASDPSTTIPSSNTHSYLKVLPYPQVASPWQSIKGALK